MKSSKLLQFKFLLLFAALLLFGHIAQATSTKIELPHSYNARKEPYFSGRTNILGVAAKGTRADVLESIIADNGLPAYRVRFQNGDLQGRSAWIYGVGLKLNVANELDRDSGTSNVYRTRAKSSPLVNWGGKTAPQFSGFADRALKTYGQHLTRTVPSDIGNYCPSYSSMSKEERRGFWSQLVSGLVKYESSYKPADRFNEAAMGIDPTTGRQVVSAGLMQLSYQDERTYSRVLPNQACALTAQRGAAIYDPETNLNCGVAILDYQVSRSNSISELAGRRWTGGGSYWSVLRTPRTRSGIQQLTRSYCSQVARSSSPRSQRVAVVQ